MKKFAIALVFVMLLTLCACKAQSGNNAETTAATEVTTEAATTDKNAKEKETTTEASTDKNGKKKESSTLESVDDYGEGETIPFEELEGDSTTKKSGKETTTKKKKEKPTSPGKYELPVIPIQ